MRKSSSPVLAFVLHPASAYTHAIAAGIAEYAKGVGTWSFAKHLGSPFLTWEQALAVRPDALIAPIRDPERLEWVKQHFPLYVNYSGVMQRGGMVGVITDDRLVGREAAEHLSSCGVTAMTGLLDSTSDSGKLRLEGFRGGMPAGQQWLDPFPVPGLFATTESWQEQLPALRSWLQALPRPCGLFATHNSLASLVMQICQEEEIRIPADIALLGVSHHDTGNAFLSVPLSYVPLNGTGVGSGCAELLDRRLRGDVPERTWIKVPPLPVHVEQSTAYERVKDPLIAIAMERLRHNLASIQSVEDLMQNVPLSRRAFEMRFRKVAGMSPRAELERMRIQRVKQLLTSTNLSLQDIAERVGFTDARHISISFRRCCGIPPMAYRRGAR